jgi:REP element-mobilizing transposase RayT
MPRRTRFSSAGYVFHVLNRAAGRRTIFENAADYDAFVALLEEARRQVPMPILAYCVMPNHWHLVLWPETDDALSAYIHWLSVTHAQRWHAFHGTAGTGPLYQGRFKSVPVQMDDHYLTMCRYVERNALRANLVAPGGALEMVEPLEPDASRAGGGARRRASASPVQLDRTSQPAANRRRAWRYPKLHFPQQALRKTRLDS